MYRVTPEMEGNKATEKQSQASGLGVAWFLSISGVESHVVTLYAYVTFVNIPGMCHA